MIPGIVSNCWRAQLEQGTDLSALVDQSRTFGYRAIELRQTCLGRFESHDHLPDAEALRALPQQFPSMQFDLAVAVPFMDPDYTGDDRLFEAGFCGARALAGEGVPHLRLVDLITPAEKLDGAQAEELAAGFVRLARRVISAGGRLSIEHAAQPWGLFRDAFRDARGLLDDDAEQLLICYDPVNLLAAFDKPDPVAATQSLLADELSMVHFKQRRAEGPLTRVESGQIDWASQVAALQAMDYHGPALFEIEPHAQIWQHLSDSRAYLESLGLQFATTR